MILDEKIDGTLDQGRDCLIIFEKGESVEMFEHGLEIFKNLDTVLDSLYDKTQNFKQKYHQWEWWKNIEINNMCYYFWLI